MLALCVSRSAFLLIGVGSVARFATVATEAMVAQEADVLAWLHSAREFSSAKACTAANARPNARAWASAPTPPPRRPHARGDVAPHEPVARVVHGRQAALHPQHRDRVPACRHGVGHGAGERANPAVRRRGILPAEVDEMHARVHARIREQRRQIVNG